MKYKGYTIEHYRDYYRVIDSENGYWTEDTIQDAKASIDTLIKIKSKEEK